MIRSLDVKQVCELDKVICNMCSNTS